MATIKIPTPLRAYTGGEAQIAIDGENVGNALDDLVTQYPDLRNHLFKNGELRSFVNIFLDDEDVRYIDGMETEINTGTKLRIIPSIAGGSR